MALTDSLSAVAKYIQDMIDIKKVDLGLKHVYYGEQNKIPNFPAATVEAVEKLRTLNGAPRRTEIEFSIYVIVYHAVVSRMTNSTEVSQYDCDVRAENVENLIHSDPRLGGLAVHSLVERIESGTIAISGTLVRATRLNITVKSQVQLPSGG